MNQKIDWNSVVKELGPALFRHFVLSFDALQADELVQETFVRLVNKVQSGHFDPAQGNLRMYAYGIARYVRLEALRPSRFQSEVRDPSTTENIIETLSERQQQNQLRRAIVQLSEIHQNIIHLYLDDTLTLKEIAILLEIPEGTVKSHISRAKDALKTIIHQSGGKNES